MRAQVSRWGNSLAILLPKAAAESLGVQEGQAVDLTIEGVPAQAVTVTHLRVDEDHSNSYAAWKRMGSPQPPTAAQIAELEKAGKLQALSAPSRERVENGRLRITFALPGQGVSLLRLAW